MWRGGLALCFNIRPLRRAFAKRHNSVNIRGIRVSIRPWQQRDGVGGGKIEVCPVKSLDTLVSAGFRDTWQRYVDGLLV